MINERIICKKFNEDDSLYMKVTGINSAKIVDKEQDDIVEEIENLNQDVLNNDIKREEKLEFELMIEATDGQKTYKSDLKLNENYINENRIRSNNALNCISDDEVFVSFIYKFLVLGTYDINPEYDMIVIPKSHDIELTIVKTSGEFAIKLISIPLIEDSELTIDLFQWFNLINEHAINLFAKMNHLYRLNKLNEFKVKKLINDNEQVLQNYEKIKTSSEKFVLLLNAKKRKILELSNGDESKDVFINLNHDREEIERYDVMKRSSIDLTELSDNNDEEPIKKRKIIKQEQESPVDVKQEQEESPVDIKEEEQDDDEDVQVKLEDEQATTDYDDDNDNDNDTTDEAD